MKYFIKNQKNRTMKKFFAIAFIAAAMVACNNSGDTTATPAPADTNKMAPADTNKMAPADTSKAATK
jgi:hypothetical protein